MISAAQNNLKLGMDLLHTLSPAQYTDASVRPYHASIGIHIRHILDVFDCIFCGLEKGKINLTARKRNEIIEQDIEAGLAYFEQTIEKLEALRGADLDEIVKVTDDLGTGLESANYTLAAVLIQAHSHAIHHYASVGYILSLLGASLPDGIFGYNPTTPEENRMINAIAANN